MFREWKDGAIKYTSRNTFGQLYKEPEEEN